MTGVFGVAFEAPGLLLALAAAWTGALLAFGRLQGRAVRWIEARSAPRFRPSLTRYTGTNLERHLAFLWLLGILLALAAAGPFLPGEARVAAAAGRVVLLIDASASMGAEDLEPPPGAEPAGDRLDRARQIAHGLVDELDEYRFALATFSGIATFQLPLTGDRQLLHEAISLTEMHVIQRNSGSSFTAALDAALHFAAEGSHGLQAVLLSDGEASRPGDDDYADVLAALEEARIPVHTVALGSEEGQGRVFWDPRDPAEERGELVTFATRRVDRHLRRMARATDGWFSVDGPGVEGALAREIRTRQDSGRAGRDTVEDPAARRDLSGWLLVAFLVAFVVETVGFGRRPPPGPAFDLDRLGDGLPRRGTGVRSPGTGGDIPVSGRGGSATGSSRTGARGRPTLALVALALILPSCGDSLRQRAHRENEAGIALDRAGAHGTARTHYRRSIEYGVEPQLPLHNLARSRTLAGAWSEAHDLYQEALEIDPGLTPALYNDGVALWRWGEAERDPRGCQLERTRELWQAAARRFADAAARDDGLARRAAANRDHLAAALAEVESLIADPPPECRTEAPAGGGAEGGAGGEGGGEGGGGAGGGGAGGGGGGGSVEGGGGEGEAEGGSGEGDSGQDGGPSGNGGDQDGGGDEDEGDGNQGDSDDQDGDGDQGDDGGEGPQDEGDDGGGGGGEEGEKGESGGPSSGSGGGGGSAGGGGSGPGGDGTRGGGVTPLTAEELEQVRQALERLGAQREEEGKFFRRSRAEQFPREVWENPDEELWW